jgi:RHS repeat-associated protein
MSISTKTFYRSKPDKKRLTIALIVLAIAALGFFVITADAQSIRNTDHNPDKVLKSNARVNPSTLAMEMTISVIGYPGRVGNGKSASFSYSSKVWGMDSYNSWESPLGFTVNDIRPRYAKETAAGWSSSLGTARLLFSTDVYRNQGAVPGEYPVDGQMFVMSTWENPPPDGDIFYMKRVQILMPDGSTHEMRASDQPVYCGTVLGTGCSPIDYTGTYLSVDGSRMRLESGSSSSVLYLPDGGRYVFGATTGALATATTAYDTHGNKSAYNTSTRAWTDTMGRVIEDPFPDKFGGTADGWGGVQAQTVGTVTAEFPGFGGSPTYDVDFEWAEMEDSLLYPSDALRYTAWRSCSGQGSTAVSPYLFGANDTFTRMCKLGGLFNPVVLKKITLPNGQFYEFKYNVYGEIAKIIYPTGAYERFEYSVVPTVNRGSDVYDVVNRGVTDRYVSEKGDGTDELHWTYSISGSSSSSPYVVTTTAPDGTYTQQYIDTEPISVIMNPYGFGNVHTGRPYEDRVYDGNDDIRSRKLTTYAYTGPIGTGAHASATRDMRPVKEISIIFEPGDSNALATMTETVYDTTGNSDPAYFSSLNPKQTKKYHYVVVNASAAASANITTAAGWFSGSTPATVTEMDYLYDANYKARNINGLVTEVRVLNPTNLSDVLAKSQFVYDETAYFDDSYTTTGWEDPNSNLRGNVTTARTWNKDTSTWIESYTMFDNFGNVRKVWDTSGDPTRFVETEYDPIYKYAYQTKTKAPAPDPTGVHGTTEGSEVSRVFDFNTGLVTSVTDANGQTATTEYDALLRPIRINPPAGGSVSETIYNDTPNDLWVKSRQQIDEYNWAESTAFYDNLGRATKTRTKDLQGDVVSQVKFDNFGRVEKTSNPYRVDANGIPTETVYWSKLRYDERNRVVETFAPAPEGQTGISLGTAEFGISTLPNLVGTYAVAIDPSGRKSRAISGIYGVMRVDEATGKGGTIDQDLGTLANPSQPTFYNYNVKGELTKITQGSQNRYFMYDSLGRLIRVRQPEQTPNANLATTGNPENNEWTASYTYDVFNHIARFTDANGINIVNEYDLAGRATSRCYTKPNIQTTSTLCSQLSESQISLDTPKVDYYYDGKGLSQTPQFSKGSLTKITNGISEHLYLSFDNHGRLLTSQQTTDGQIYGFAYRYNLSGALIEETYPSGRVVKNILDTDGGLSAVTSRPTAGSFKTVATNFDYLPSGAVKKMMLGNGRWETAQFNERFQLTQLGLGNSPTDKSLWKIDYEYGELSADGTTVITAQNTGSIARQTTTIPTTSFIQTYKYDSLNRLTEAKETASSGTQNWKQTFGYDRFGNRTSRYQKIGDVVLPIDNHTLPTIDQTTNRFVTGQGYVYDFNGNLVQDAEGRSFTFDANDKQIQVTNANQQVIGSYFHDSSGARVKKVTLTETTIFVYDAGGRLAAEYSTGQNPEPTTSYLTSDHLGSPRVITDRAGNVISRRDFMPFGEEIYAGIGGRTESQQYSSVGFDNIRKRFTGYEKDAETGLDYAQARMYQNSHGRFTIVDPLMASAFAPDPQTFNRYTYTGNNPVNNVDPTGLRYYRNRETLEIAWFDKNPGGDWDDYTDQRTTIGDGGCFATGRCVVDGDDVTFRETGEIIYHNRDGGAAIVNIGIGIQETFLELTAEASELLGTDSLSLAPAPDAPTTIDLPTGGPGGGPLEPIGGSDPGGGTETGGEIDAGGGWQVTAAKILWFLGNSCFATNCWESDNDEEEIELYRGVGSPRENDSEYFHERFRLATLGTAIPRGGHSSPERHNGGDTDSIFTSWTTDQQVAEAEASFPFRGVVLTKKFPASRLVASPDEYDESEVLVIGPVTGASVKWLPPGR